MLPPIDEVYVRSFCAWEGVHDPFGHAPALIANDVTTFAFAALANSITPRHCARVSTPPKPGGGAAGAGSSESEEPWSPTSRSRACRRAERRGERA